MARTPPPFGRLVRHRRKKLGMSQEELAAQAEVSVRHLSYVETGKSAPSRELVVAIACALGVEDVGLFLEAAGFIAPYPDVDLSSEAMAGFRGELQRLVDRQPFPALLHDRFGTIHVFNPRVVAIVTRLVAEAEVTGEASGHRLLESLRPLVKNWDEVARLYRRRLFRELVRGTGEMTEELLEELYQGLEGHDDHHDQPPSPTTPLLVESGTISMRFDFVTVTLGTPQDIGLRNYRMVLFMPSDEATEAALRELTGT